MVKYDIHEDLDLSYHYDNAEVTLNVSLGEKFTEGNLYFGDMRQVPLSESVYRGRAGNDSVSSIEDNTCTVPCPSPLASAGTSLSEGLRRGKKLCPMCKKKPILVEGQGFTDGFTSDSGMSLLQNV